MLINGCLDVILHVCTDRYPSINSVVIPLEKFGIWNHKFIRCRNTVLDILKLLLLILKHIDFLY